MLGVGWTHGAFRDATPPAEPYEVHFPNHWACVGAPLGAGNTTAAFMGYETDGTDFAMEDECNFTLESIGNLLTHTERDGDAPGNAIGEAQILDDVLPNSCVLARQESASI